MPSEGAGDSRATASIHDGPGRRCIELGSAVQRVRNVFSNSHWLPAKLESIDIERHCVEDAPSDKQQVSAGHVAAERAAMNQMLATTVREGHHVDIGVIKTGDGVMGSEQDRFAPRKELR